MKSPISIQQRIDVTVSKEFAKELENLYNSLIDAGQEDLFNGIMDGIADIMCSQCSVPYQLPYHPNVFLTVDGLREE